MDGAPELFRLIDGEQARRSLWLGFDLLFDDLVGGDVDVLVLDVEAQAVEEAHVDIGDPDQGEPADEIAAPAAVEHLESRDDKEECRDVVAEAVLAGEEIEELSSGEWAALFAPVLAPLAGLAEDFFVGNGPGDAGDGKREQKEICELAMQRHEHSLGHSKVLTVRCRRRV